MEHAFFLERGAIFWKLLMSLKGPCILGFFYFHLYLYFSFIFCVTLCSVHLVEQVPSTDYINILEYVCVIFFLLLLLLLSYCYVIVYQTAPKSNITKKLFWLYSILVACSADYCSHTHIEKEMKKRSHKRFTAERAALALIQDLFDDALSVLSKNDDNSESDHVESDIDDDASENLLDASAAPNTSLEATNFFTTAPLSLVLSLKMREKM